MLDLLFFLISRWNNACFPLVTDLQINQPIGIKDRSHLKVPNTAQVKDKRTRKLEIERSNQFLYKYTHMLDENENVGWEADPV